MFKSKDSLKSFDTDIAIVDEIPAQSAEDGKLKIYNSCFSDARIYD